MSVGDPAASIESDGDIFRFLVENSPDGIFIQIDEVFVYLNKSALKMLGYGSEMAVAKLRLKDVIHPEEYAQSKDITEKRLAGEFSGAANYRLRRKDGNFVPVEVHAATLKIRGKDGTYGIIRDITDRRKMQGQLERMEHSNLVSRLAAGIAHEFNNLLAVILSNTEVAASSRQAKQDPEVVASLQRIRVAVERGSAQVKHIQRMGGGRGDSREHRPLWLNPLVEDVLELTRARWRDEAEIHGLRFNVHWEAGLAPPIKGDNGDLRAALVALVFNALDAMPEGGRLTLRTGENAQGEAFVLVRDTGVGVPAADIERLTDAFFTTRAEREMGMGLSLVQSVLERHGGRLEIESALGAGSTFRLFFPKSTEAPAEPPPAPRPGVIKREADPTVPDAPDRPKTRGGRSVLLIDDQADLLQVVRNILESRGYCVDIATNGKEGLALAKVSKYSAVLTDLGMPDISGWEVAQRIHELAPGTPVVLMTGWAADIDDERLEENKVHALLSKPFRSDTLLETISKVLEQRRAAKSRTRDLLEDY